MEISRDELLYEPWKFDSFIEARNFALDWCNYYDLDIEIEPDTKDKFYVIFSEPEND